MFKNLLAAAAMTAALAAPAYAQLQMTNDDVIKLVASGVGEDVVMSAIRSSKGGFDTSADALVALKTAGVSDNVIQTMILANVGGASNSAAPSAAVDVSLYSAGDVMVLQDGAPVKMKYVSPQMRTKARGMGFGGVAQYAAMPGAAATLRLGPDASFQVVAPENAQPESYFALASFAVRKNKTREVLVGGGYASYSTGIHPDRIIPVETAPAASQDGAPAGHVVYDVKPTAPLAAGEYALVVYTGEMRAMGIGAGMDSYYDFGVDG